MGFFDRWFKRKSTVPAWAGFLSFEQHQKFMQMVLAELSTRALTLTVKDGSVDGVTPEGKTRVFGLLAIAQRCHKMKDEAGWRELVHDHFAALFTAEDEAEALLHRVSQFDAVKHALRVNVYGQRPPEVGEGRNVVHFDIAEGLYGVVVLDFPTTTRSVSEAEIEPWDRTTEELIKVAVANTVSEPVQRQKLELSDNTSLTVLGGGFFTSSRVLRLEKHVPVEHPWGALVSVPNRNTMLLHPIVNTKAVVALNAMVLLTRKLFADGPGSVSQEVYWWRQGTFSRLPTQVDDESVRFAPSPEFLKMMEQLAQPN